jgi:hypothetical protein
MVLEAPRLKINGEAAIEETLATNRFVFEKAPEDLRAKVSEQELVRMSEESARRVTRFIDDREYNGVREALLGTLTYFYAIGVYGSHEIAMALARSPNGNSLHIVAFQNAEPTVVLRRFRRANRPALEYCLCDLLKTVCQGASNSDVEVDANRRVTNAVQTDTFVSDF